MSRHADQGHDPRSDHELLRAAEKVRQGPALAVGLGAGVVLAVAAVLAIVQNGDDVRFEWVTFDVDAPLWLLLVAAMVVGALLWALTTIAVSRGRSHRTERRRAAKEFENRGAADRHRSFA